MTKLRVDSRGYRGIVWAKSAYYLPVGPRSQSLLSTESTSAERESGTGKHRVYSCRQRIGKKMALAAPLPGYRTIAVRTTAYLATCFLGIAKSEKENGPRHTRPSCVDNSEFWNFSIQYSREIHAIKKPRGVCTGYRYSTV